ncbi:Magnesium transporter MRS2, mitochondrial [Nakaseomyces bracarensis]|uniref:Magnesium transporter n=1 Tax=Nakaseomyces bracarensis TaxID=273131 RepID=A0ABR4NNZ0_9SACH
MIPMVRYRFAGTTARFVGATAICSRVRPFRSNVNVRHISMNISRQNKIPLLKTPTEKSVGAFPSAHQQLLSLKPITPNESYISCTVFDSKGKIAAVSKRFQKWQFLREHSLFPRDLRKIDTSSVDIIPTIQVKPNSCILLNMLHIKALIEKDRVYVFDTVDPSSAVKLGVLMYDLESKLSSKAGSQSQLYEHRALESILINIMSSLEAEFKLHFSICGDILSDLENEVNRDKLRELLIKSKNLTLFYQKSLLIREVLDELLESDDDLASLYLTVPKTEDDDFADLEMMIETYYTQCDEYVQQSESLIQDIKNTEEIVNIILDANRNSLMHLELKITIYTLGFTVATLIPAFYGMNLKNFIEESYVGFGAVVVLSAILGYVVTRANFKRLKSVTKVTMLKTTSGIPNSRKTVVGRKDAWSKFINRISFKKDNNVVPEHHLWNKQDRDLIWKWLIDEKKN